MNVVVDTSVIIAVIVDEPGKDRLVAVTKGATLIAPASVHWEICNALSAMQKRQRMTLSQATQAIDIYGQIPIRYVDVELVETLRIAAELSIYAYDAYLIRCCAKYDAPLITLDRDLKEAARMRSVDVIEVEEW